MTTRRTFLGNAAALLAGSSLLGPELLAATQTNGQKFIFLFAEGGWDTTKVFYPPFDLQLGEPEPDATLRSAHGIDWVDHPNRPAVSRWFEGYGDVSCVINGMLVRSINHWVCTRLVVTGSSTYGLPDWPSILGAAAANRHALPNLVLAGPNQPGKLHRYSSIVGDSSQLQALLDRGVFATNDLPVSPPPERVLDLVDEELQARLAERMANTENASEARMLETMTDGLARTERLAEDAKEVRFEGTELGEQIRTAVSLLAHDIARCISISSGSWDMHSYVDEQDPLIDGYFDKLAYLTELLRAEPGSRGGTLADETTIVVLSEMGRTPYRNDRDGKHHWPYTSAMLIGAGVRGGKVIGGHDAFLNGLATDLVSGDVDPKGSVIVPNHLGATLMRLAGIDPELWVPGFVPIAAALS